MENFENNGASSRRNTLKMLALGSTAGLLGLFDSKVARADSYETPSYQKGLAPVTITKVRAILTAPGGSNLVIVKVETSEPGLYGVGCATFTITRLLPPGAVRIALTFVIVTGASPF